MPAAEVIKLWLDKPADGVVSWYDFATALTDEEATELSEQIKQQQEEEEARLAAEKAEAERVAALEERMEMARQWEEDEKARFADEVYAQSKKTVARVEREYWAPKRAIAAEEELKLELRALRTWPAEAELPGLKIKIAPLIATPGVSPDLIKRMEKAMEQAERAKVEARAKAITDSVDRFVGGLAAILPDKDELEGGWPFVSAQQRLPVVVVDEPPQPKPPPSAAYRMRFSLLRRALRFIKQMPPMT